MDCVIKILSHSFWSQLFQKCFFRSSIFGLYGEKKFFLPTSNNWQKLFFTTKTRFSSIRKKLDRWGTIIFLLIFISFNHHECAKKIASLMGMIYHHHTYDRIFCLRTLEWETSKAVCWDDRRCWETNESTQYGNESIYETWNTLGIDPSRKISVESRST